MSIKSDDLVVPVYAYPYVDPDLISFVHLRCCTNDSMRRIGDQNKRIREALGK